MRCCFRGSKSDETETKICKQLQQEAREIAKKKQVTLLLVGAGESGKSTIAKQMRILFQKAYESEEERQSFIPAIHCNILTHTKEIIKMAQRQQMSLPDNVRSAAEEILVIPTSDLLTSKHVTKFHTLLDNPEIMGLVQKSICRQVFDQLEYMLERLDLFVSVGYIPTMQDILRVHTRSTGILELQFRYESLQFNVLDMGGQRSQRRKWLSFFESCTAVVFVVAMNELREDPNINRMHESLELFKATINHKHLIDTPVILFFNKMDLFKEKLPKSDLKNCFEDYTGGNDYDLAVEFIYNKFKSFDMNKKVRLMCSHPTSATDTYNMRKVFGDIQKVFEEKSDCNKTT